MNSVCGKCGGPAPIKNWGMGGAAKQTVACPKCRTEQPSKAAVAKGAQVQ